VYLKDISSPQLMQTPQTYRHGKKNGFLTATKLGTTNELASANPVLFDR